MECKSNIFGGWKKYDERGGCFSRYSSGVKRKEEDDASRAPLPIHSATLFPRGSLRPKFIARGNAFIPSVTLPSVFSSYFYRHRVLSLFSSSSTSRRLVFPPFLSVSFSFRSGDNHDPREYQMPRLPSISPLGTTFSSSPPLLAVRGTVAGAQLPPRMALTRLENTLRRDNLVRGPRLSFERNW